MQPSPDGVPPDPKRKSRWSWSSAILLLIAAIVVYTQFTIFVIPPIGAFPEGHTVIILRLNKTEFIDSPDAMCERIQGGVSLLCRGMALGAVGEKSTKILSLPYSRTLYLVSTGDKTYER
jgi:hypothetical protein